MQRRSAPRRNNAGRPRRAPNRRPRGFFSGHRLSLPPDPPSFTSLAPLATSYQFRVEVSKGTTSVEVAVSNITDLLKSQYGLDPTHYSLSIRSLKVWSLSPALPIHAQFFDVHDGGMLTEITDTGAPTRYATAGFQFPEQMANIALSTSAGTTKLATLVYTAKEDRAFLLRFELLVRFFSKGPSS